MGMGPMHLFVLVIIALLFFGPSKLPALGKSMGEAIKGFKDAMNDVNEPTSKNVAATTPKPTQNAIESAIDVTESANSTDSSNSSTSSKTPHT